MLLTKPANFTAKVNDTGNSVNMKPKTIKKCLAPEIGTMSYRFYVNLANFRS